MASHHCDVVVLPTLQVKEVTVGACALTFAVVAEAASGVDGVRRGTESLIPRHGGDAAVTVH